MEASDILLVGIGGGLGSLLRWQLGRVIDRLLGTAFKFSTLFINLSGALVIAYLSTLLAIGWEQRYGTIVSSLVLTGLLGGYTTFSTMQLDAVQTARGRGHAWAVLYLACSVGGGLVAAAAGVTLARS